jgi:hypothetical protein
MARFQQAALVATAAFMTYWVGGAANSAVIYSFDGNLVAYYSFDDGATATDDSANSNDGVITGAVHDCADTPPTPGNACSLDFESNNTQPREFVNAGNDASLHVSGSDFTIAAWVNLETVTDDRPIVSKMPVTGTNRDGWRLLKQGGDGKFWFCFGGGSESGCTPTAPTTVRSTTFASLDTWTHVVGVKEGTDIAIYVNGLLEGTSDMSGGFTDTNAGNLHIGRYESEFSFFDGKIDEVRLYNVALTEQEIAILANAAAATITDTCDVGGGPPDIETVTASYDFLSDEIVVEMVLCSDADNGAKYWVFLDHEDTTNLDGNGIDDGPDTLDPNPDCVRTFDHRMFHEGTRDRGGTIDVTGNTLTFRVAVDALNPNLGLGDTVLIWAKAKHTNASGRRITDKAPTTETGDKCAKPQVPIEVISLTLN